MACFYGDKITRVSFAGIDHIDGICAEDAHGKRDHTSSVDPGLVITGETYTLSVTVENNSASGTEWLRAWIDHDRNGVFSADESIDLGRATGNAILNTDIVIPDDAVPGITRMRIMYRRTNALQAGDACHSYGSYRGQVKDYLLRIESPIMLPVELLTFTLHSSPDGVLLEWATASETNSASFTVQHSTDARQWENLTTLPAAGNSHVPLHYQHTHRTARQGVQYYRLQQTDIGGETRQLPVRSISLERSGQPVAYPNPCSDSIRLRVGETAPWSVVHAASGQSLPVKATLHGDNEWELDTRSLPAGTHLIHLHEQGHLRTIRFVKQ